MLSTPTVMKIENVTSSIVKRRYFPSRGTAREVGGMISASRRKNTVSESRMLIQRVTWSDTLRVMLTLLSSEENITFSPESAGR